MRFVLVRSDTGGWSLIGGLKPRSCERSETLRLKSDAPGQLAISDDDHPHPRRTAKEFGLDPTKLMAERRR